MTAYRPAPTTPTAAPRWDIFCQVIDNFGDIGVCWRLAAELGARGVQVTLRIDDASALAWMAPQGADHVQVLPYDVPYSSHPDVVIEAFGCEAPPAYLAALAQQHTQRQTAGQSLPKLVNLEYLSAEDYVERCHRLPSLIMSGPASGMTRWFFYPGFTSRTGGLVLERSYATRHAQFARQDWRSTHGVTDNTCAISLFCYEPAALPQLLAQLQTSAADLPTQLLVTPGRATAAVQAHLVQAHLAHANSTTLAPTYLPIRTQAQFDEMLWACDLNLVRGEDSLVRALWAGQAFVWHIYPQHDNAHHDKLNAFLDWLQAPASLRAFHHAWNGMSPAQTLPTITPSILQEWRLCAQRAQEKLRAQTDLITQLQQFVAEKS